MDYNAIVLIVIQKDEKYKVQPFTCSFFIFRSILKRERRHHIFTSNRSLNCLNGFFLSKKELKKLSRCASTLIITFSVSIPLAKVSCFNVLFQKRRV